MRNVPKVISKQWNFSVPIVTIQLILRIRRWSFLEKPYLLLNFSTPLPNFSMLFALIYKAFTLCLLAVAERDKQPGGGGQFQTTSKICKETVQLTVSQHKPEQNIHLIYIYLYNMFTQIGFVDTYYYQVLHSKYSIVRTIEHTRLTKRRAP